MWMSLMSFGLAGPLDPRPEAVIVGGALLVIATLLRWGLRYRSGNVGK
jgi:hypothetical protein